MHPKGMVETELRAPLTGEMLREDFLPDYGLTVSTIAKALGVSRQTVKNCFVSAGR